MTARAISFGHEHTTCSCYGHGVLRKEKPKYLQVLLVYAPQKPPALSTREMSFADQTLQNRQRILLCPWYTLYSVHSLDMCGPAFPTQRTNDLIFFIGIHSAVVVGNTIHFVCVFKNHEFWPMWLAFFGPLERSSEGLSLGSLIDCNIWMTLTRIRYKWGNYFGVHWYAFLTIS